MKVNRLLEIIIILLNRGTVTAKELADRFGVSTRTIYRDIDVLSYSGVPVFTSKGNGGGISLLEDFSLNKTILSKQESESMMLALKTLQATKYPQIDMILDKIGGIFKNAVSSDFAYIDFSPWSSNPNEHNKFADIKEAILSRTVISFDYINADGSKSSRSVEPMKLIFKGQAWYLWGYCKLREDFRTFRISRIKNVVVTKESFERRNPDNIEKRAKDEKPKEMVNLKLKFYPQALHRLYDDFDEDLIKRNADGTFDVSVSFPEDEWVYGYIMSYGCNVEVLEPDHIRRMISDRLKRALKFYEQQA
ncbi:YafY family protein [Pseudoclostridium thermosuccinogenes]|uniref:helix-turn-helix transcriptional regulator n=1 Tax=Clostridium thermosuccinogenes TaxID=84032 RepID=UPI002FDB2167